MQVLGVIFLGLFGESEEEGAEGEQWRVDKSDGEGDYTNDVPLIGGGKGVGVGVVSKVNHDAKALMGLINEVGSSHRMTTRILALGSPYQSAKSARILELARTVCSYSFSFIR